MPYADLQHAVLYGHNSISFILVTPYLVYTRIEKTLRRMFSSAMSHVVLQSLLNHREGGEGNMSTDTI